MGRVVLDRRSRRAAQAAAVLLACLLSGCVAAVPGPASRSDAPDPLPATVARAPGPATYAQALLAWGNAEDIAAWVGPRFAYDTGRALQLSETERGSGAAPAIIAPADLFERPTGSCLDLARFGVETLQRIDPESRPRYLMVEFEPLQLQGRTLRRHWLASFRREGSVYVFADSKRPWLVAGPYESVDAFIQEYERFRARSVVRFYETDSYQRRLRQTRSVAPQHPTSPTDIAFPPEP
jgi:hypothetical protein